MRRKRRNTPGHKRGTAFEKRRARRSIMFSSLGEKMKEKNGRKREREKREKTASQELVGLRRGSAKLSPPTVSGKKGKLPSATLTPSELRRSAKLNRVGHAYLGEMVAGEGCGMRLENPRPTCKIRSSPSRAIMTMLLCFRSSPRTLIPPSCTKYSICTTTQQQQQQQQQRRRRRRQQQQGKSGTQKISRAVSTSLRPT